MNLQTNNENRFGDYECHVTGMTFIGNQSVWNKT